jgi:hypothetical protein
MLRGFRPSRAIRPWRAQRCDGRLTFFSVEGLKDGKPIKLVSYGAHAEALETAGLRE